MAAYKTPHQPKENQCQNGVAKVKVQGHDVAANFTGDDEAGNTSDQPKMKEACRQVPNAYRSIGRREAHKKSRLHKK
jgi:hypothetical protein